MTSLVGAEFDYTVVGAGPAGLAAAGFLAKSGARVAVYEGRPRPQDVFGSYPVVLNARGIGALEQLDQQVAERAMATGMPVNELHIVPGNRTVAKVPTWGTGIMRDQAAQILLESAEQSPNITFFWEHKILDVDVANRACTFRRPDGLQETMRVTRLVAADGNRSQVRQACEKAVPGFTVEADPWGFQLRFMNSRPNVDPRSADPALHYVLGDKGYMCQQPNAVWSVSLRVLPEQDEDFLTANEATADRIGRLREYTETQARLAADLLDEQAYRDFYSCRAFGGLVVKCSCLNPAGWICLIGDAAHAVQPATGEGINSGLEDAAVLGRAVVEHPEDPFAAFDAEQRPNAHALNQLALQAKQKVVSPPPRQQAANIMVTIGLGIAKKLHIVEGTAQDFMLGEKARQQGVKPYAELLAMDARQTRGLRKAANVVATVLRIPKENAAVLPKTSTSERERPEAAAMGA